MWGLWSGRLTCPAWRVFIRILCQKWGVMWLATGVSDYLSSLTWTAEHISTFYLITKMCTTVVENNLLHKMLKFNRNLGSKTDLSWLKSEEPHAPRQRCCYCRHSLHLKIKWIQSYNLGQNCADILVQFSISHHATIVSNRNKFAPLPTSTAMLLWLNSSSVHFLCYSKQHCNRGGQKQYFNLQQ